MATRTFLHLIALIALIVAAGTTGRGQESKIWTGVYSSEQAEQGKELAFCGTFTGIDVAYLDTQESLGVLIEVFSNMPGE